MNDEEIVTQKQEIAAEQEDEPAPEEGEGQEGDM